MKTKRLIGLLLTLIVFSIILVGCEIPEASEIVVPTPAAPTAWWMKATEDEVWVPYEVKEVSGDYYLFLELPEEAHLYLAKHLYQLTDVREASTETSWVSLIEYKGDTYYYNSWDELEPLVQPEINVERLIASEYQGYYQLGYQKETALFYIQHDDQWWSLFSPSFAQLNMLHQGRLRAVVCNGYNEEDLISLAGERLYP